MTYRDDQAARAARLEALERELTQNDRTARGLEALVAHRDEDPRERAHRVRTRPIHFGRAFGMAVGVIGGILAGLIVGSSGCAYLSSLALVDPPRPVDFRISGTISASTRPLARAGDSCVASVSGTASTDHGCTARVTCGGVVLYAGTARCDEHHDGVMFRDDLTDDGTPLCVVSERAKVAAINSDTWTASIE